MEAAAQVLERDGYTASTTDLIAERAGVSIGSVYQYFPNKDALLLALAQRHADAARAVLEPLLAEVVEGTPPVGPWLRRFVRAIVELNGRRPRLHQILFEETPFPQENMEEMYRAGELIVGIVESYLARAADVKVANPRLAAYLLFRSIGGIAHAGVVRRPPDLTMQDCGEELILILVRYLTGGDDTPLAR